MILQKEIDEIQIYNSNIEPLKTNSINPSK